MHFANKTEFAITHLNYIIDNQKGTPRKKLYFLFLIYAFDHASVQPNGTVFDGTHFIQCKSREMNERNNLGPVVKPTRIIYK